jgi:CubicO group peptidase (beta-lactamase class C family)
MMMRVRRGPSRLASARLDAIGRRLEHDATAGLIPGATIVVGRHDRIVFERSVGFRDVVAGDPLRPDAIWRIYSMTKPVVSVATMVLMESGALRLDQPVADFIPSFANLRVACTDGTTVPIQRQPTVQDLLRHTAGVAYGYLGSSPAQKAYVADGFLGEDLPLAAFADRIASLPLEYQPGTVWHYSHATDILGRVLEVVFGRDLDEVLRCAVLGPLGMAETGFRLPALERGRIAQPLPHPPETAWRFFDPSAPRRMQSAGGGLVSTAADYSRFLRMLLSGGSLDGRRILGSSIVAYMTSDHLGQAIRRASYYPPGPGYGFGLGFAVRTAEGEAPFPGSRGDYFWSGVGGTYFWVDPAHDLFALLMLQSSSPEQRLHYRTLMRNMVYAAIEH